MGDVWSSRIFLSSNLVGRIFFPFFPIGFLLHLCCMQFFSSDKRLQEIFFQNHSPPSSRVKWSAPNAICHRFKRLKLVFALIRVKKMIQICYLRLYLGIETVSCCRLQRIVRITLGTRGFFSRATGSFVSSAASRHVFGQRPKTRAKRGSLFNT